MLGFSSHKKKHVYAALIDISSGSVGVAIVATQENDGVPTLLYTHRTHMRITKYDSVKADNLRRVREALFSASLLLSQEGYLTLKGHDPHAKISQVYVTCSSPWSYTLAQNVQYENDIRFKINQSIIDDLIQSAVQGISNHLKDNALLTEEGFETVEQATMDIRVNDYQVTNPVGLSGTTVSLSHIVGLVPKEISTGVHEVQDKLFRNSEHRIHTYILVMFCVIQDMFRKINSLCIIDVTGEATEFGIAENGLLLENTYIPHGSNTFIRSIMQKTGKPQSDVSSLMQAYSENSQTSIAELGEHIDLFVENLAEGLRKILERRALPKEIFITVHRPHEKLFKDMITAAFKKVSPETRHIVLVDSTLVNEISKGENDDVYLALGARFFHKLHSYSEATKN